MAKTLIGNIKGPKGDKGAQGAQGAQGPTGATGETGPQGLDGDSAYQIAVNNGFEGSEEDWLASLEGGTFVGTITGTNPTTLDSTNAPLIYCKFKGYASQDGEPTPDNPIEINRLAKGGAIEVKTTGKNLFNKDDVLNGLIVNDGKPNTQSSTYKHAIIKVEPNQKYTRSRHDGNNFGGGYDYAFFDKNNEFISVMSGAGNGATHNTFTTPDDCYYLYLNATTEYMDYLQLEKGKVSNPIYKPYQETTTAIPTDAPFYEGDYLEIYADGSGKLVRAMAEVMFDGSADETWYLEQTCFMMFSFANKNDVKNTAISTHFVGRKPLVGWNVLANGVCQNYDNAIGFKKTDLTTVAEWKTWLQSNPVTVVYELAEPTKTPLTTEQVAQFKKLYTFEPVTNVLCDGEVEMRYYKANVNGETVGMLQEQTKDFAKKAIYGDTTINVGRKADTTVGDYSSAVGTGTTASGYASLAEGFYTTAENTAAHAEGSSTKASGLNSHAEGFNTNALESNSHAEGCETIASGLDSHAEGNTTTASGEDSHAEGYKTIASQKYSHAEGNTTTASGLQSHAEGNNSKAIGAGSHAEGYMTEAKGNNSHAEGDSTTANKINSHAEGRYSTADGDCSHAEGYKTNSSGLYSHSEGNSTTASGTSSHSEGYFTTASGLYSHAEGNTTKASGNLSHAEGDETIASGVDSHAEGAGTVASGDLSHAEGYFTTALTNQHAQGHYNNTNTATANSVEGTSTGTAFVIGNGTSSSVSNALRVTGDGYIYATNANVQTGADYAEYFEWADGNPNKEDRVGYFVTFDEDNPTKIRIANEGDYILGIVSGMPSIIGNGDECWKQRYVLDEFGRYIEETFEYETKETDTETGEEIKVIKIGTKWKENPEYDHSKTYIPRKERAEWSAIGMIGVLSVYDDGNCQAGGYCRVINGGISTVAERGSDAYRVLERVTDNIIKIVLK